MLFICLTSASEYEAKRDDALLDKYIAAIAAGDKTALAGLYNLTDKALYGFALAILQDPHDAEDALHDCYLDVFASAADYRSLGKPMAWLFTIARNRCLTRLRQRGKQADFPLDELQAHLQATPSVTPEDSLTLEACMQLLTDEERQIVVLHAVAGFKHREIADFLSYPLSTVLAKYHRALKKLKAHLTKGEQ